MAKITRITAPVDLAVSVTELQTHAKLGGSDGEEYLGDLLSAAEEEAETETWRRIVTQTWDQYFDAFASPLTLWYPPLSSVTSVKYLDTDGAEQTLSTDVWESGEEDGIGIVRLKYNQSWPVTYGHPDSVYVRFICGYGVQSDEPTTIPAKIRQAIRFHAAWFYRNREDGELPQKFKEYLSPYSVRRFVPVG